MRTLTDEDVEAIAARVADLLRHRADDPDPWLTRTQAAQYLNVGVSTFCAMRNRHPDLLKPCSERPRRWSKNALDVFKMGGAAFPVRRGRKRTACQV